MQRILVFAAHSDDQVLGVGGTLAKYALEGAEITVVVFSLGELTHPWLQRKYSAEMRVNESKEAGKRIGSKELMFFGLKEGKFKEDFEQKGIKAKAISVIEGKNPNKIFIHSPDDLHPDHRDAYTLMAAVLRDMKYDGDVYSFEIWNPVNWKKQDWPQLYIDITPTFKTKLKALGDFQSQKVALTVLMGGVLITAILSGIHHGCRFAERFYKVPL